MNKYFFLFILISASAISAVPTEDEVLSSTKNNFPVVNQAMLQLESSQNELLAAKGGFDTRITSNSYIVPKGYFTRRHWDAQVEKPLRFANSTVYAGFSNGHSGIFPDQYSTQTTNSGGSPRIGGRFSLIRGFSIDSSRANLASARLGLHRMKAEMQYTLVQANRDARIVYWNWISSIRNYRVYKDLLTVAENRKDVLDQRVKAGDISEVVAKENLQYVARRTAELASAELSLKQAALDLSLFYRDAEGKPILLDHSVDDGLEEIMVKRTEDIKSNSTEGAFPQLTLEGVARRPDVFSVSKELAINDVNLRLAENLYFPKLDIGFDYTRNLGDEDPTNAPHVVTFLFSVEIPLEYNLIKGQVRAANAQKRIVQSRYKFLQETAQVEVNKLNETIRLSQERMESARLEMKYAKELLESENYKFQKGGSNFFLINIREESQAQAQENYIISQLDLIRAFSDYEVATTQFKE